MNREKMNQKQLLLWISMLGFCADDILLYLDTHPKDANALDYYNQCNELYNEAYKSYEEEYGMLRLKDGMKAECWDWTASPMPWEGGKR